MRVAQASPAESRKAAILTPLAMIQQRQAPLSVLFVELNEAEQHFLRRFVAEGKLPAFARMLEEGAFVRTRIPGFDPTQPKAWRVISPWIVWPSLYTGLTPAEHGLIGFGQDTSSIHGRCVWDVLDAHGISVGVLGSLMSFPPRTSGAARYYVPESLADDPSCFPDEARALQEFCVFGARNYSVDFARHAREALTLLWRTRKSGARLSTIARTMAQVPLEKLAGAARVPERAMLHSYLVWDAFRTLYGQHRPRYASVHLNHVAYMQHRYWRAAEPQRFQDALSATDQRFFQAVDDRKRYEERFHDWIEKSFRWMDARLAELFHLVDNNTVVVVGTALGVRPFDPVHEIHNPVVRLVHEGELFAALQLPAHVVLHQMNPDITVNFEDEGAATRGAALLAGLRVLDDEGLFHVQRRGRQVFCELNMPQRTSRGQRYAIRHDAKPDWSVPLERHVEEHGTADQSTAHHKDSGWCLAWSKGRRIHATREVASVTAVAPTLLSLYGLPAQPWMTSEPQPFLDAGLG